MNVFLCKIFYNKFFAVFWGLFFSFFFNVSDCFARDFVNTEIKAGESPDVNFFDAILLMLMRLCMGDLYAQVAGYSVSLFQILIGIDLVLAVILGLLAFDGAPNFITLYANKILKYGFWIYVIKNWNTLVVAVSDSLVRVGLLSGISHDIMLHPSEIVKKGYGLASGFWDFCTDSKIASLNLLTFAVSKLAMYILGFIGAVITFVAFFLIALNVFLTTAEFYICAALSLIFIPFAVFDKTERFSSSAINLVIAAGAKMMVFTVLLGFIFKVTNEDEFTGLMVFKSDALQHAMFGVAMIFVLTYVCTIGPSIASSLVNGGTSFGSATASGAMGFAQSAAGAGSKMAAVPAGAAVRAAPAIGKGLSAIASGAAEGLKQDTDGTGRGSWGGALKGAAKGTLQGGGDIAKGLGQFAVGAAMGTMKATIGGREEGMEVFKAASGKK